MKLERDDEENFSLPAGLPEIPNEAVLMKCSRQLESTCRAMFYLKSTCELGELCLTEERRWEEGQRESGPRQNSSVRLSRQTISRSKCTFLCTLLLGTEDAKRRTIDHFSFQFCPT